MNSSNCAMDDATSIIKAKKLLVEPAGTHNKGHCVKTGV